MIPPLDPVILAASFELAPVGLCLLAPDGRPLRRNAAARRLQGAMTGELRALDGALLSPGALPSARLLAGLAATAPLRLRARDDAGEERLLELEATGLRDADGRLRAVLELVRELTAEAPTVAEASPDLVAARAAAAARDEFLQIASHDLRNPLGVVALNAELLEQLPLAGEERARRLVGGIRRAAAQMSRLVSDLLDVAALDAGQLGLVRTELDAGAVVREVVEQLRERATVAGVTVVAEVEGAVPVRADRGRLLQILGNLAENALRVSPAGESIELSARATATGAELTISDRGPGLAAGEEARLFQRFQRGAKGGRVGLGLAIARGLVEAHGGALTWEPRAGGGSVFRIRLPG